MTIRRLVLGLVTLVALSVALFLALWLLYGIGSGSNGLY